MDEKQETIADILEELRSGEYAPLADRLEAAMEREKATAEKSSAVGDCAKLREALEVLLNAMCSCDDHLPPIIREGELREAYHKAESALAAPPRNCDKYSHDEALRIWSAEPENPMNGCFDDWLYAPATKQKGENDGRV